MASVPLPKRRCENCKYFIADLAAGEGFDGYCTNVAIAQNKPRVPVRATFASCAGLYHGKPDLWEARRSSWWPFGR